jgi:hypothetical protein
MKKKCRLRLSEGKEEVKVGKVFGNKKSGKFSTKN